MSAANTMQARVAACLDRYGLHADPSVRLIDLVSEMGELGKAMLTASGYGSEPVRAAPAIRDEMGDCIFSLLALCESLDIDAAEALSAALDKYAARFRAKGHIGSGQP